MSAASAAWQLLARSRYAGGPELAGLTLVRNGLPVPKVVAETIHRQWMEHLGIDVPVQQLDGDAFQQLLRPRGGAASPLYFTMSTTCADYPDRRPPPDSSVSLLGALGVAFLAVLALLGLRGGRMSSQVEPTT